MNLERTCANDRCAKTFEPRKVHQRFCSKNCNHAHHMRKYYQRDKPKKEKQA